MIFDGNDPAMTVLHRPSNRLHVNPIYKWVVNDASGNSLLGKFSGRFDGLVEQWSAPDQNHIRSALQHLRPAPGITGVLDPAHGIILASDEENVVLPIPSIRPVIRKTLDRLIHERFRLVRAGRSDHYCMRQRAGGREV